MKKIYPRILILLAFIAFAVQLSSQPCPSVLNNLLTVSGECNYTLTFQIDNPGDGDEGFVYAIHIDDKDNPMIVHIDNPTEYCVSNPLPAGATTVTHTYSGGCSTTFELSWKSYFLNTCVGDPCDQFPNPLAVELKTFSGTTKNHLVELNWTTAKEENNQYFEIQRSEDGINFENIGMVEGKGTAEELNHYSFTDRYAFPFAYYRLKQTDIGGAFQFSEIITVLRGDFESKLMVYPTQAFDQVTVRVETLDSRKSYLRIVNISGQVMYETTYYGANDAEYLDMDVGEYPPGIYFVSLTNKTESITSKFAVVKD